MKKFAILGLVLMAFATFGQRKVTLSITDGEIVLGKTTSTQTYTYKGSQVVYYNLNPDRKINVYLLNPASVLQFDTTLVYSFNGSTDTATCAGIMAALKSISTVAGGVTQDSLNYKMRQQMGLNGHYPAITTTATTYIPNGWCVNALEATVIASLSFSNAADSLTTITLAAGQSIYGKFKHIKLTSGKVIVYK